MLFRRNNITIRGFLKLYEERFTTRGGIMTVKDATDTAPAPEPASSTDPAPGSVNFQKLSMAEQIPIVDGRTAARKQVRQQSPKARISGLATVYKL